MREALLLELLREQMGAGAVLVLAIPMDKTPIVFAKPIPWGSRATVYDPRMLGSGSVISPVPVGVLPGC